MKLTEAKRQWVYKRVKEYIDILNIPMPELILTRKEYEARKDERRTREGQHVGRTWHKFYGVAHRDENMIALNLKLSPNLARLDQTIRHEVIHLYRRYNHRSERFYNWMEELKQRRLHPERNHELIIISLHDAQAKCKCGRWYMSFTGERTKEQIQEVYATHLK